MRNHDPDHHHAGRAKAPDEAGYPRTCPEIHGGLVITCAEGSAWLKRTLNLDLNPDHSEDLTIFYHLEDAIYEHGFACDLDLIRRQGIPWFDFLLTTQITDGPFLNIGPPGVEEVLQDDLKYILRPGELEDTAREKALRELGRRTFDVGRMCWD